MDPLTNKMKGIVNLEEEEESVLAFDYDESQRLDSTNDNTLLDCVLTRKPVYLTTLQKQMKVHWDVYKLPFLSKTKGLTKALGDIIGEFLEVYIDSLNKGWGPFSRIRVKLDVTKPLRRENEHIDRRGSLFFAPAALNLATMLPNNKSASMDTNVIDAFGHHKHQLGDSICGIAPGFSVKSNQTHDRVLMEQESPNITVTFSNKVINKTVVSSSSHNVLTPSSSPKESELSDLYMPSVGHPIGYIATYPPIVATMNTFNPNSVLVSLQLAYLKMFDSIICMTAGAGIDKENNSPNRVRKRQPEKMSMRKTLKRCKGPKPTLPVLNFSTDDETNQYASEIIADTSSYTDSFAETVFQPHN
uniref:Uncharacterized protein n=1 Tax=Cannabis sativa TaxID=3483 RepID=A0A803PXI7_CANSA